MNRRKDKFDKLWPNIVNMASIEERLTAALEQIAAFQISSQNPYTEIKHIPEFDGNCKTLTQFLSIVETHLEGVAANRKTSVWNAIYNIKVTGKAKELILNNAVTTWEAAKILLTQHFRPILNIKDIIRKINLIKVNTISELCSKIENLICEINSYSVYEENKEQIKTMLYQTLISKVKELVTSNLSREIKNVFDIHMLKQILYTYIGFDDNLDLRNYHTNKQPKPKPTTSQSSPHSSSQAVSNNSDRHRNYQNDNGSERFRNNRNDSNRFRNQPPHFNNYRNNQSFNPSGQFRNASQNPQPMEVDHIQREETNNNIEEQVFLN